MVARALVPLARRLGARQGLIFALERGIALGKTRQDSPYVQKEVMVMEAEYHYLQTGDAAKAGAMFTATLDENWQEKTSELSLFAHWSADTHINPELAYPLAIKSVILAQTEQEQSQALAAQAKLSFLLGKQEEAQENSLL